MKKLIVILSSLVLSVLSVGALSSCGSGQESTSDSSDKIINVYGCEPQNKLVPGNTTETCGGNILGVLFDELVSYSSDGKAENDVAESITPSDGNKVYEIKIKSGLVFDNGEAVTSESFIKAWNYTAVAENAQGAQSFFAPIKGYKEVAEEGAKTKELSGLVKVSDLEFKIELNEASVTFPLRLGYSAFAPLPVSEFDAEGKLNEGFGDHPIGNGPYKFSQWNHDMDVKIVKSDTYKGNRIPKNGGIDFKVYTGGTEAAYADIQSGALDVLEAVPMTQTKTFQNDPQIQAVVSPSAVYQGLEIPDNLAHFGWDEEGQLRRAAISRAIDRQAIIDKVSDGLADHPVSFSPNSSKISGATDQIKGNEVLQFDAAKAKELWTKADAISKFENPKLDVYYNADGGGKPLLEAVANSIKANLDIESSAKSTPDFKTLLNKEASHTMDGAFRMGWQPDYPSVENYLAPLYSKEAAKNGSNYSGFSNDEFEELMVKGGASDNIDDANKVFVEAEEVLFKYLPCFPLYDPKDKGAAALGVKGMAFDWHGTPDYINIIKD
ncbi:MAG: ABC transporter substrate-binding protein [Bifidobacteriaceae bacterium]|jgi:oligopeptide transport system substrate-binding protein|nr:ABC transporter substrate-binding protein [Bifidobacteriaceae bacterium]